MEPENTRKSILKSTSIVGGSQIIIIILGILRTKVLAILLGPVGVGIAGLYQSTIDIIKTATGFGLNFSAVRDIAAAAATNDIRKVSSTVKVLRRWVWVTGFMGSLLALLFCKPLSKYTFGNESYSWGIALSAFAILTAQISSGQLALLQGLRRIGDMARANVFGAIVSLLIAVPIYWFLGNKGILPAILTSAFATVLISWYFSKRIKTIPVHLTIRQTFQDGRKMAVLGFFTVITGFAEIATMYLVRTFIVKSGGLDIAGQFIAAWTISSLYLTAILNAMGADYFPRLSGAQNDQVHMNRMINEQTEIALLSACPVIIAMISFIEIVINIFYSARFNMAIPVLNWQLAGDFFKILSWPIGFAFLAKGKGKLFILANLSWCIFYLSFVYFGWQFWNLEVTGIAFMAAYAIYLGILLLMSNIHFKFQWSSICKRYIITFTPLVILAFIASKFIPSPYSYMAGSLLSIISFGYSLKYLRKVIDIENVLRRFRIVK